MKLGGQQSWRTLFTVATSLLACVDCAVFEGELPPGPSYAKYVGKFCFNFCNPLTHPCESRLAVHNWRNATPNASGSITISLRREGAANKGAGKAYFLMYDDESRHWKHIWKRWTTASCEDRKELASYAQELNIDSDEKVTSYRIPLYEHLRPRFWYFAFAFCGNWQRNQFNFTVHTLNVHEDWQAEFGADQHGMIPLYGVFACLFCLGALCTYCCSGSHHDNLEGELGSHPYCRLLLLAYVASTVSCISILAHYVKFMSDGLGSQRLHFLGVMTGIGATNSIFVIAILISKGWAISSFSLPNRRCLMSLIAGIGILCAACELYGEISVRQSTKLYGYQSPAGVSAITLKIFMFSWFSWEIRSTYEEALQDKSRGFYKVFGVAFSLWFATVPVTSVLAFYLDPWNRFKVVAFIEVIARFVGLALLSRLLLGPLSPITPLGTARQFHMDSHLDCLNEDWKNGHT